MYVIWLEMYNKDTYYIKFYPSNNSNLIINLVNWYWLSSNKSNLDIDSYHF